MVDPVRTARLLLRPWQAKDRAPFARLNRDPRVMEYFPRLLTMSESDAAVDRLQAHIEDHGWGLWAVEIPGVTKFAGFIGLARPQFQAHFTPCVEIGWRLDAACWGQGYATEGAAAALAFGLQTLKLTEIVSFTTLSNHRSMRVMQKIGLTHDPRDDFDHPTLADCHPLRRHVLYRTGPALAAL